MIDISIPREYIYQHFKNRPSPCPRCGSPLQSHSATYLIATSRGKKDTDSFLIGSDMGWFCARCPIVVVNPDEISEFLLHSMPNWDIGTEFAPVGIVDLDAIPEEKRNLPLGDDDNPIPLIRFTNSSHQQEEKMSPALPQLSETGFSGHTSPRRGGSFEEHYEDVLQNIEFGIIQVYRDHPELVDWDALNAIEALLREYQAEAKGRQSSSRPITSLAQEVYSLVKSMCEWRLGRETFVNETGEPMDLSPEPITLDEIIACLKRIRKSINRWNRKGGQQGYLTFVDQFIV